MKLACRLAFAIAVAASACGGPATEHEPAMASQPGSIQRGLATWYGESQATASGERFDKHAMTAAHRSLPFNTVVRVTNQHNGRSVVVRINDRGPFGHRNRIIDLSEAAASALHMIDAGVVPVVVEVLSAGMAR